MIPPGEPGLRPTAGQPDVADNRFDALPHTRIGVFVAAEPTEQHAASEVTRPPGSRRRSPGLLTRCSSCPGALLASACWLGLQALSGVFVTQGLAGSSETLLRLRRLIGVLTSGPDRRPADPDRCRAQRRARSPGSGRGRPRATCSRPTSTPCARRNSIPGRTSPSDSNTTMARRTRRTLASNAPTMAADQDGRGQAPGRSAQGVGAHQRAATQSPGRASITRVNNRLS
jgi:hypothetical protein